MNITLELKVFSLGLLDKEFERICGIFAIIDDDNA